MSQTPGSAADEGFGKGIGTDSKRTRHKLAFAVVFLVVLLDQTTKAIIKHAMAPYESFPVVEGIFNITRIFNTGAAFGFLGSANPSLARPLLISVSVLALGILLYTLRQLKGRAIPASIAIGLILGGAVGNLIDRILFGGVVDFLDLHWRGVHWPAFNVADSSITIGMILFLLFMPASESKG